MSQITPRKRRKPHASLRGLLQRKLLAFHRDERGAIAVLVLLILWILLAVIGLVWNNAEESYRRQRIQTAADAAAHSAATWMARTVNSIDSQNMVISQDASEETIWRAVPPTDQALMARLQQELALIQQMKQQQGLQQITRRMQTQLANIATEYQLMTDALDSVKSGNGANYADPNEALTYLNQYRQIESVRDWVWNTYVQGNPAPLGALGAPARPGPPGPSGQGLAQIVQNWQPPQDEDAILDYITGFINNTELPIVRAFEQRTAPGTSQPVDQVVAQHEAQIYAAELSMAQNLWATIDQQRAAFADQYQTDITLATLKNSLDQAGSAHVMAPLMPAGDAPPVTGYTDSIRAAFPAQAQAAGLNPVIDIDAINAQVNAAIIWHPNVPAPVPANLLATYPSLRPSYTVSVNPRDANGRIIGWGEFWAMPLEHYVHQRVNADAATLQTDYMTPLDQSRSVTLAQQIRLMLGLPNNGNINIANLPGRLPDDQPEPNIPPLKPGDPIPPPRFDQINVMPALTAPANATPEFRAQVALYNQHGGAYTGAVRALRNTIISYTAFFNRFTQTFAAAAWQNSVNVECITVLEALGQSKQFMVLSTYGLRPIPDWAKPGMFDSASAATENQLMLMNIQPIAQAVVRDLQSQDSNGVGNGILDQQFKNSVTYGAYIGQATQIADQILRPQAHIIAQRIAAEWVNRPWPYEITPPDQPVPPFRGIGPNDRKREFSVIAAARQTDASAPGLLLANYFGNDQNKLVAYGQGETFNWMEFNSAYGGGERFDEVVSVPEVTYRGINTPDFHPFVGAPRGWRVDSLGGWNWRARLSLSDALYDALQVNGELADYLQSAGVNNPPSGALDEINLH